MEKNLRAPKAEIREGKCIYRCKTIENYGYRKHPLNRNGSSLS